MHLPAWEEINQLLDLSRISKATYDAFLDLRSGSMVHTKKEGNPRHYCSFFLPFDKQTGRVYLGHHKKADDWIPPGGHIEPGETPSQAAIREMQEELGIEITPHLLEPFTLSVKHIGRPESGCLVHYDVWHLVKIKEQNFEYLKSEYHDAGWFTLEECRTKITKNPDFREIVANLQVPGL